MSSLPRFSRRDLLSGRLFRLDPELPVEPPESPESKTAVLLSWSCLAHRGTFCSVCVEHCPVDQAMRLEHGRPVISRDHCTGCGICVPVCPSPSPALVLKPWRARRKPQ